MRAALVVAAAVSMCVSVCVSSPAWGQLAFAQSSTPALWRVSGPGIATPRPPVAINFNPAWASFSNVAYMGPFSDANTANVTAGFYTYTTTLDLSNHLRKTFTQTIQTLADDNVVAVRVNGRDIPFTENAWVSPGGFTVSDPNGQFLRPDGTNELSITVANWVNSPTGLAVRNLGNSVQPVPTAPVSNPSSAIVRTVINMPEGINAVSDEAFMTGQQFAGWSLTGATPGTASSSGAPAGSVNFVGRSGGIGVMAGNALRNTSFTVSGLVSGVYTVSSDDGYATSRILANSATVTVNVYNTPPTEVTQGFSGAGYSPGGGVIPPSPPRKNQVFTISGTARDRGMLGMSFRAFIERTGPSPTIVTLDAGSTMGEPGEYLSEPMTYTFTRSGTYNVFIRASDGQASTDSLVRSFTVSNAAPVLGGLSITAGGPVTPVSAGQTLPVVPGIPYTLSASVTDADADPLSYVWRIGGQVVSTSASLNFTPSPASLDYPVTFTVTDNDAAPLTRSFTLSALRSAVPEPGTLGVLMPASVLLSRRRRTQA